MARGRKSLFHSKKGFFCLKLFNLFLKVIKYNCLKHQYKYKYITRHINNSLCIVVFSEKNLKYIEEWAVFSCKRYHYKKVTEC